MGERFRLCRPARIFTIDANEKPARITSALPITRGGQPAQLLDLEGIVVDGKGGFWLASEGRSDTMVPHGILHVNDKGAIDKSIGLPEALAHGETRYGFEGITAMPFTRTAHDRDDGRGRERASAPGSPPRSQREAASSSAGAGSPSGRGTEDAGRKVGAM